MSFDELASTVLTQLTDEHHRILRLHTSETARLHQEIEALEQQLYSHLSRIDTQQALIQKLQSQHHHDEKRSMKTTYQKQGRNGGRGECDMCLKVRAERDAWRGKYERLVKRVREEKERKRVKAGSMVSARSSITVDLNARENSHSSEVTRSFHEKQQCKSTGDGGGGDLSVLGGTDEQMNRTWSEVTDQSRVTQTQDVAHDSVIAPSQPFILMPPPQNAPHPIPSSHEQNEDDDDDDDDRSKHGGYKYHETYYKMVGGNMKETSKHRSLFERPKTPDGFWDMSMEMSAFEHD